MTDTSASTISAPPLELNVADRLAEVAAALPEAIAVVCPGGSSPNYRCVRHGDSGTYYSTITFAALDADATRLACGLLAWGVPPGSRLALMVRPGIEFVSLVFALLRAGMVMVLIDPGLGRRNLIRCLSEVEPEGFIAIPAAQAGRLLLRRKFPRARWNVTVGRRWFWGGLTLNQLRALVASDTSRDPNRSPVRALSAAGDPLGSRLFPITHADDAAAIIFTSGSTGPPKGVLYTHHMFDIQVGEIQLTYGIEPGGVDLACFPLFALFNSAMGVTTVLPEMDFSRPAAADPLKLITAANDWRVTQAFASPAAWRVVSEHCATANQRIQSLRQVFSCGAPVPAEVQRATLACVADGARMHTPYGATECLPVATIEGAEVLAETTQRTDRGAGICVGRKFDSIEWRIIRITDAPITTIDDADELPVGEIGELIVCGPQASSQYVTHLEANAASKIADGGRYWHRMGDVGYFDDRSRFWYCGRKSQRVATAAGPLFTECVEAVFNRHPDIELSALVGIGPMGDQLPVIAIKFQLHSDITRYSGGGRDAFPDFDQVVASAIPPHIATDWLDFEEFLVDVRHNSKINREFLRQGIVMGVLLEPDLFSPELVSRAKHDQRAVLKEPMVARFLS